MERVVKEKNKKEMHQEEIDNLNFEVERIQKQLTMAQYGEGEVDENGIPV